MVFHLHRVIFLLVSLPASGRFYFESFNFIITWTHPPWSQSCARICLFVLHRQQSVRIRCCVVHVHQGTCVNHIDTCWNRWCHFCFIHFGAHLIFIVVTSFIWQQEGILFRMEGTIACSRTHTQHIHTSTEDNCKWENAMLSWHAEMLLEWTTQMFVMCRLYRFSNECFCYCCCCCLLSSTVLPQPISISFLRRNEQTKDENEK